MKFAGKVTYFGDPAEGVPVNLLDPSSGEVLWSGLTNPNGFFSATLDGVTKAIAAVAGEFDAGLVFPPTAKTLSAAGNDYLAIIAVQQRTFGEMHPYYGVGDVFGADGRLRERARYLGLGASSSDGIFWANEVSLQLLGNPTRDNLWATFLDVPEPTAKNVTTDTVHTESSLAFPTVIIGALSGYQWRWEANKYASAGSAKTYSFQTSFNSLKDELTLDGSSSVTQEDSDADKGLLRFGSLTYTGMDLRAGSGYAPAGWAGIRYLMTTVPAHDCTYGLTNNGEIFAYAGPSGWVKMADMPNPIAAGNTKPSPFPNKASYIYSGATHDGTAYVRKQTYGSQYVAAQYSMYSLSEYALTAGAPAGLVAADEWCQDMSQHCMYGTRAIRFAFTYNLSSDYPSTYTPHGISDYDFVTDTLTVHAVPSDILTGNGTNHYLNESTQSYVKGDSLLLHAFPITGYSLDQAHLDTLRYNILTETREWLPRQPNVSNLQHPATHDAYVIANNQAYLPLQAPGGRSFRMGWSNVWIHDYATASLPSLLEIAEDGTLSYALADGIFTEGAVRRLPLVTKL